MIYALSREVGKCILGLLYAWEHVMDPIRRFWWWTNYGSMWTLQKTLYMLFVLCILVSIFCGLLWKCVICESNGIIVGLWEFTYSWSWKNNLISEHNTVYIWDIWKGFGFYFILIFWSRKFEEKEVTLPKDWLWRHNWTFFKSYKNSLRVCILFRRQGRKWQIIGAQTLK